jgi:hypothetical protein
VASYEERRGSGASCAVNDRYMGRRNATRHTLRRSSMHLTADCSESKTPSASGGRAATAQESCPCTRGATGEHISAGRQSSPSPPGLKGRTAPGLALGACRACGRHRSPLWQAQVPLSCRGWKIRSIQAPASPNSSLMRLWIFTPATKSLRSGTWATKVVADDHARLAAFRNEPLAVARPRNSTSVALRPLRPPSPRSQQDRSRESARPSPGSAVGGSRRSTRVDEVALARPRNARQSHTSQPNEEVSRSRPSLRLNQSVTL